MPDNVVLYRSHFHDAVVEREVRRLRQQLPHCDHYSIGYREDGTWVNDIMPVSKNHLLALGYTQKLEPDATKGGGADDLAVLWFFRRFSHYKYYWCIEYDVRYSGHWRTLFDALAHSQADLLATTVMDWHDMPNWEWWRTLKGNLPQEKWTKAFLPFCRISNRALQAIDAAYRDGVSGHYEASWGTICRFNDLTIEDIGGDSAYTPPDRINQHYFNNPRHWTMFPGTFCFRPCFWESGFSEMSHMFTDTPKLWHPVKW